MTQFKPLACGFHSHQDFSLDGGSTAESKLLYASEIGRIADCVTDHGIMSGLVPHWMAAEKLYKNKKISKPIKSIHGIELYIVNEDKPWREFKNGKKEPRYYHLTIHFKTEEAYLYFCRLTPVMESRAIFKMGEAKPLAYLHELEPIAGQITIGSGCLVSPVQGPLLEGRSDLARKNYIKLRNIAGPGNFFVEVFPHHNDKQWSRPVFKGRDIVKPGEFVPILPNMIRRDANPIDPEPCVGSSGGVDIQKLPNLGVLALAQEFGDPVVISLDDHYARAEDRIIQEMRMSNSQESWRFYGSYHMATSEECAVKLKTQLGVSDYDIEKWIDNSYKFVDLFSNYKVTTSKDRWLMPTAEMIYGEKISSTKDKLFELIKKHGRMREESHPDYKEYKDRLDYEVSVLADNGMADWIPYLLIMEDLSEFCKKNGILCNVRGSAGGSLVLFLLEVSVTDPIKYNLPFERFLTVERIRENTPPDVDFDVEDRDPVIEYIFNKYKDSASLLANDITMKLKGSILDAERAAKGHVPHETADMVKKIPPTPSGVNDLEWLFGVNKDGLHVPGFWDTPEAEPLKKWSSLNKDTWNTVVRALGVVKTRGVHAGGILITPGPVQNYMPVIKTNKGITAAYSMKYAEAVGAIKFDILGVSTLKAMSIAMKSVRDKEGVNLEWGEFPYEPGMYEAVVHAGNLGGLFQISTRTMRPYVSKIKPLSIEDLSMTVAVVRPGTLEAPAPDPSLENVKAIDFLIGVRSGKYKPFYIHKDVEDIFKETSSVSLYQEQLLHVFRKIAGYTFGQAESVRRAVGKKIKSLMEQHLGVLKEKCLERGWSVEQADLLVETLIKSARYSFNKSHSQSYAIVCHNGIYLKHKYPLHYWKGEFQINNDDPEAIQEYMRECKGLILPVDIIASHPTEWMIEGNHLRPPLALIKGCGGASVTAIKDLITLPIDQLGDAGAEDNEKEV